MLLHITIYIITIFISIVLMAFLAVYSWRHREFHGALAFGALCLLGTWGALAEFLSMISGAPETAALWYNARFITLSGMPVAWLVFSLQYSGRSAWITPKRIILLLIIPFITQVMVWTKGLHNLWLKNNVGFFQAGPFLIADTSLRVFGPWFMVHTFYGYASLGIGVFLMLNMAAQLVRIYRNQALALAAGTVVLTVGSAIPTFNLLPELKVNPIMQGLSLGAMIFAWSIFRYRFLDIVPVARDILIDSIEDGMLVLDIHNRIVDINQTMLSLLGDALAAEGSALPKRLIGLPVMEVLRPWRNLAAQFEKEMNITTEVEVKIAGQVRFFNLRLTSIIGRGGMTHGKLLVLNEITGHKRAEESLRENEERLRLLSDSFPDGIVYQVDFGVDGASRTFTYISAGVQQLHGLTPAEVLNDARTLYGQIHEDDRDRVAEAEAKAMASMSNFSAEFRVRRPSGDIRWHLATSSPRRLSNNHLVWDGIEIDITDRKLAENLIQARLRLIEFAVSHTTAELLQNALDEVCAITDSPIGFYHFVEPDQVTLFLQAWSTRTEREFCKAKGKGMHYRLDEAGVWVDCVHQRRPVIHNDYASLPHRKGMPEGHAEVVRELVVPILRKDKIVAILGVGNKPKNYNDKDIEIVSYMADVAWEISRRKRAEEALQESEHALRERNLRMEHDLKIAQMAQKGMIQGIKPKCDRLAIDFRYKPMEKVGGDYFSFFLAEDQSLGFFIGDVSGHGIASALFIALLKAFTDRMFRLHGKDPSGYLKNLNGELIDYMTTYFVTGIYGVLDSCGREGEMILRFSNGGHTMPIVVRRGSGAAFTGKGGDIIGISNDVNYPVIEERLRTGDRLFVYTDGIPETINDQKVMIGFDEGMLALFDRSQRGTLSDTLDAVMEEVNRFKGSVPVIDDITLIGFEVA